MAKTKELFLTHTEIEYLLELALDNKESGTYWGRRDYFQARQDKVIHKLEQAANTKAPNKH
ncbi:MAG: hypothetical protein JKX99_10100 [Robiginitomaculum sp.]|nr:hypothetical protein [Robiginitomaculum sp.]